MPQAWLSGIFASEEFPFKSQAHAQSFFDEVLILYNTLNQRRLDGTLVFPFELDKLTNSDRVHELIDWTFGFRLGLQLRHDTVWSPEKNSSDVNDLVMFAFSVLDLLCSDSEDPASRVAHDQLFDEYALAMLREQGIADFPENLSEEKRFSVAVIMLPSAIKILQDYAARLEESQPAPPHQHDPDGACCGQHHDPDHAVKTLH